MCATGALNGGEEDKKEKLEGELEPQGPRASSRLESYLLCLREERPDIQKDWDVPDI